MLMSSGSLLIATSALVGYRLTPDKALATLPLALQLLAGRLASIPASLLMQAIGRRAGFLIGNAVGVAGAALAAWAIVAAALGGMLGYDVMALVMTATPLAMHEHHYAFSDTAFVIE